MNPRLRTAIALPVLGLLLAGCDAQFSAELNTDPPADSTITSVEARLRGLDLRKADGTTDTLEFRDGELVDLLDLRDGNTLRLFTDEKLPDGRYTGVRLLFDDDEDDNVVARGVAEFPLLLAEGAYAAVDFQVQEDENSEESISLALDLRQSLSFDDARDEYTLRPRLRAVPTGAAARIEGTVAVTCPVGTSLATGGAPYLYQGNDVTPDDLDGAAAEPYATTGVVASGTATPRYALRLLPAGKYTLALTCRGNEDELGVSNDVGFRNVTDVEIDDGDVLQRNLN
jgi:Domain of unknown function (DUF4382)